MSDEHGGACCDECAAGRACAGDSCGLAKAQGATVKGAMRVPAAFQTMPAGQAKVPEQGPVRITFKGYLADINNSIPAEEESAWATRLLSGTGLTCQTYLALSQARRQNAIAIRHYGLRTHVGERPFNSFFSAMDALNESERRQAISDVLWLNQHCAAVEIRRIQQEKRMTTIASGVNPFDPFIGARISTDASLASPYGGKGGSAPAIGGSITNPSGQGIVGQGYIGSSLGMGSVGQGYIGKQLFPRIGGYTFGATPYPWDAGSLDHLPANPPAKIPGYWAPYYGLAYGDAGPAYYVAPAGQFVGTLSMEQRARMYNALTPAERAQYDAMTPAAKTQFESNYASLHWDVISGTVTPAQAQQNQAYLGAAERALGLTFGTISTAMANNNQQRLAEITAANNAAIANINAQLQRDLAPAEATRLRQELANFQYTQSLLDRQRGQNNRTWMYVGGAAAILIVGGVAVYALRPRTNPVIGGRDNRHGRWVQPKRSRRRRARARSRA